MSIMLTCPVPAYLVDNIPGMARRADTDKPKKVGISARVDPTLAEKFEAIADIHERTVSYFVEKAMAEYLEHHERTLMRKQGK